MAENNAEHAPDFIALAGDITIAWLQNPNVHPGAQDVPAFMTAMHAAITQLGSEPAPAPDPVTYEPAVPVRSSVKADHLVSLIDGKKYKTLKRHLATNGLTPDDYRARYGLKSDYPMVAESYTAQRRAIAEKLGLGRKRSASEEAPADAPVEAVEDASGADKAPAKPKRAARKPKDEPAEATAPVAPVESDVPVAAPAKAKRAARGTLAATVSEEQATTPAKPRRMARKPVAVAEAPGDAPVAAPQVESAEVTPPAKPKRAAAPKKAAAASKAAPKPKKPATKSKSADAPAKTPRVKKAAAETGEAITPDA